MSSRRLALIPGSFPAGLEAQEPPIARAPNPSRGGLTELLHSLRSDEDLAEALREGDADALTVLFKRHSRLVFGIARRVLRHDAEAEDCVQQIFIDVFRSIGQFDRNKAAFKTWLLLFAYHRTLNRRRAMVSAQVFRTESLDEFMPELLTCTGTVEGRLHDSLLLTKALGSLQPRQRRTIELTYYEGLTAEEIATRTGESVRVVRHNLYRGLAYLRRQLGSKIVSNGRGGTR